MPGILDGLTPYDTRLSPDEEAKFQAWRSKLPPDLQNTGDYDLRGAFRANAKEAANGHLPDTFKKPNHMTFSAESQYSTPDRPGGTWAQIGPEDAKNPTGVWQFNATPANLQAHTADDLLNYFQAVENNKTVDPKTGRISYGTPNRVRLPRGLL
jgi:hypothetical protein